MEFHKTPRNMRTASSEQVRQPIIATASTSGETTSPGLLLCGALWAMR